MTNQEDQEDQELVEVHKRLYESLFKESGRGAVLIATSIVEEQLLKLIESILPMDITKDIKKSLLKYPGPLSSFAAKTHIAYAFRLIDRNVYDSLNALRDVRNDAAHSTLDFELRQLNTRMKKIYNLNETLATEIKNMSTQMLLFEKTQILNTFFEKYNLAAEEKAERIKNILEDKNSWEIFENQIPVWELINGLYMVCGIIINTKKKLSPLSADIRIWSEILIKE